MPIAIVLMAWAATVAWAAEATVDTVGWRWLSQAPLDTIVDTLAVPSPSPPRLAPPAEPGPGGLLRSDRLAHASLALGLGVGVGILSRSPAAGSSVAIGLGIAKELVDDHVDRGDLAADLLGAGLAAVIVAALTR